MHAKTTILNSYQNIKYLLYVTHEVLFKRFKSKISLFEVITTIIFPVTVTIDP